MYLIDVFYTNRHSKFLKYDDLDCIRCYMYCLEPLCIDIPPIDIPPIDIPPIDIPSIDIDRKSTRLNSSH